MAKSQKNAADVVNGLNVMERNGIVPNAPRALVWNGFTILWNDVPETSRFALAQSGFTHKMGNEIASAITTAKGKRVKGPDGKETNELVHDEAALARLADEKRAAMVQAVKDGTIATRVGGPKLRGFDAILRDVAEEMLKAAYAKKRVALPKGDAWKAKVQDAMANSAKVKEEAERRFTDTDGLDIEI